MKTKYYGKIFSLSSFFSILTLFSFSQDCVWYGTVDSIWTNPLNWSCNQVPDGNTNVYIYGNTPYSPVVQNQATVKNLIINNELNSIATIKKYLDAAYKGLSGDQGYGSRLSMYFPLDNDEMMGPIYSTSGDVDDRRSIAHYSLTANNNELYNALKHLYTGIERADSCINYIQLIPLYSTGNSLQKAQLNRMYGEALTLKAQYYFDLIRNWGDVPVNVPVYYNPPGYVGGDGNIYATNLQKANRDTTYNNILNDLQIATTLLPWRTDVTLLGDTVDERITKGSAKALRAKIALFAGGYSLRADSTMKRPANYLYYYQIVKQECSDLISRRDQHTLNPFYKDVFKNTICAHKVDDGFGEIIFQVGMYGGSSQTDSKLGYYNGPKVNSMGNSSLIVLPTYHYLFDSTDNRRDVTVAPYDALTDGITKRGVGAHAIRDGKFRREWISNPVISPTDLIQYFGLNWPLIRFSDVLLMFAEADNEINGSPTAAAISAFEEVRHRGYGANAIGNTPTNKIDFFNAIVKERSLEFGGEGIRKYDLIRWNLLEQKLNEAKTNLNLMANKLSPYDNLPSSMYYITTTTADNSSIWSNSYYYPNPASTPSGSSKITWISTTNFTNTFMNNFALYFTHNKNELLPFPNSVMALNPNLVQNPRY